MNDSGAGYGIAMTGPGTLVLTGAGSYGGGTTITNGTLRVANGSAGSATGTGPVTLDTASTLAVMLAGGSGTITPSSPNTVTLAGTLSGANGATLTLGNGVVLQSGATIAANLTGAPNGTSGSPLFAISGGTFDVSNGPYTLNLSGTVGVGTYDLINYSGASTNGSLSTTNFPIGTMPSGGNTYTLVSNLSTDQLDLVVLGPITWTGVTNGSSDSNWTTSYTSTNWASGTYPTANAGQYLDAVPGVPVTFSDTNPLDNSTIANSDVVVQSAGVNPQSVTFSNNTVAYTIDSTGSTVGIGGSTGITLGGTGTVTLLGANSYTGTTTLNAGTLVISNNDSLGRRTVAQLMFNGGTLRYASAPTNTDISTRSVTIAIGGATVDINGNNITYANSIGSGGSGALTVESNAGGGTLTLQAANDFSGALNLNGGTVNFSTPANLGTGTAISFSGGGLQWAGGNLTDISSCTVTIGSAAAHSTSTATT